MTRLRRSPVVDGVSHALVLVSPPDSVGRVHELLDRVWRDTQHISFDDRASFETALIELTTKKHSS